uniref:Uncharacterized protein n=1 Tax=Physcomitrium patens TaxID=3218 RepID=A0A2K1KDU7_PHYPA|nr:hypothetical protein PHYPA_008324 [Physcomitrium patens]
MGPALPWNGGAKLRTGINGSVLHVSVDSFEIYITLLTDDEHSRCMKEEFQWKFGPRSTESHSDFILQNTQPFEAKIVFEKHIKYLRNLPYPDSKKINALYQLLIKPFDDQLVEEEPLIFIPHEDPLDDSVKEVTPIATTTRLDEASVVTLTREQATLKNVAAVMKSSSWCHIASHGEVNSEYPNCVLFLSRSGECDVEAASGSNSSSNRDADLEFLTPEIMATT